MSLELEIQKLTVAVEALTAVLLKEAVVANAPVAEDPKPVTKKKEKPTPVEEVVDATPQNEPVEVKASSEITEKDLQDLCLQISRSDDRSKSKQVRAVIAQFGGKIIKEIPQDKWPELKARLEAL